MHIFQVHHFVKPDHIEQYRQATLENARNTIQEPGVIRFDVFQDTEDPTHFTLLEIYKDKAAQQAHLQTDHFFAWKEVALEAFDKERKNFGHYFEMLNPETA